MHVTLPDGTTVRTASAADADGIGRVHVESWQWAYRGQLPASYLDTIDVTRRTRWWRTALADDPTMTVFVAEDADGIVGFCHVGPSRSEDSVGEVYALYLHECAVGRGVGAALMSAGLDTLAASGFDEAMLWVLGSNASTRRFYESGGWHDDSGRHTYTLRGGVKAPAARYRIRLGRPG